MKRSLTLVLLTLMFFTGCSRKDTYMERALDYRETLQENACAFHAKIVADYGQELYQFEMDCEANTNGSLEFTVTSPEVIEDITGVIDDSGGGLTFDDMVLAFSMLADGQISPVGAPWVLINAINHGYIHGVSGTETGWEVVIDDSYYENSMRLNIWFDEGDCPKEAEIYWEGRRIISVEITDFAFV